MSSGSIFPSYNTTVTTKGDILIHNGTSSSRLATGTNGYAVHSSTGAIKISWNSASTNTTSVYEKIGSTTVSAAVSTVAFTGIGQSAYQEYVLIASARNTSTIRSVNIDFTTSYTGRMNVFVYNYDSSGSSAIDQTFSATGNNVLNGQAESDTPSGARGQIVARVFVDTQLDSYTLEYMAAIPRLISGTSYFVSTEWGQVSQRGVDLSRIAFSTAGAFAVDSVFTVYGMRKS